MMCSMKNSNILVTGGTGFLGTNIVRKLSYTNNNVFATCHSSHQALPVKHLYKCDLTNPQHCSEVTKGMNCVIMAGAVSFGAMFIQNNPLALVNDNVIMNVNLLDACFKNKVQKVIYFGSTTGYPDSDKTMVESDMFIGDPFIKYHGVGWMKRYTEKLLELYSDHLEILNATVLRLSNVYGPYDKFKPENSHVLPAMVRKFCDHQFPLEVWGDGTESRDFIYVDDVVDCILLSLEQTGFNTYNVGAGQTHSINEVINTLSEVLNVHPEISYLKNNAKMITSRSIDVSKIEKELNFKPSVGLKEGLRQTCQWYLENKDNITR